MGATDLAQHVKRRRLELGLRHTEAVARSSGRVSMSLWSRIENGHNTSFRDGTLVAIDRALGWEIGSAARLFATGVPPKLADRPPPHTPRIDNPVEQMDALAATAISDSAIADAVRIGALGIDRALTGVTSLERVVAAQRAELEELKLTVAHLAEQLVQLATREEARTRDETPARSPKRARRAGQAI